MQVTDKMVEAGVTTKISYPLSVELCRQLFRYDPVTGKIYREYAVAGKFAGTECGNHQKDYIYVSYHRRRILAHRLAWALYYGEWPRKPIDHINCNRHDNRIANLRLVTVAENNRNRPKQSNNTTGYKGVTLHRTTGRYEAKISANKKRYFLGSFPSAEEAFRAYSEAAKTLHGIHARTREEGNVRS